MQPATPHGFARLRLAWIPSLFALLSVATHLQLSASAQDAPAAEGEQQSDLATAPVNEQPAFYVHAEFTRSANHYREGDTLGLKVTCEIDAFLYVLYQQADGAVYQLFPNSEQPNNRVQAKQTVVIPADEDFFRWVIGPPFGKELLKIYASKEPIEPLSLAENRSKQFNSIGHKTLKDAEAQVVAQDVASWAEVNLELTTYSKDHPPLPHEVKRVGVFFGLSEYKYHDHRRAYAQRNNIDPDKFGLNLRISHNDAIETAKILEQFGRLDEHRVFTNSQVTRAAMEEMICRWLPSVTKPGDTVFIGFSGHGGQIKDDNGDERDGMDEVLLTHDMVDVAILMELIHRAERGQFDGTSRAEIERLREIAVRNPDGQSDALIRATSVSDDLFGRWLQHLNGRQVVVLIDACHSGGFAEGDTSAAANEPSKFAAFDFLEGEVTRLKDIGARDQAMLAAAMADQAAFEMAGSNLSVLTAFLIESLRRIEGPVDLETSYRFCVESIREYFRQVNHARQEAGHDPITPHDPYFVNYCTKPVYLKPN